jgi:hypothetical protein
MGNSNYQNICKCPNLQLQKTKSPQNQLRFANDQLTFQIEFAHATCCDCNRNCYVYNTHGPKPIWTLWHPTAEDLEWMKNDVEYKNNLVV